MSHPNCPPAEDLSAYLQGLLPEERIEAIADHVEGCAPCRETMDSLNDASDTLVPQLRRRAAARAGGEAPDLPNLMARAKSLVPEGDLQVHQLPPPASPQTRAPLPSLGQQLDAYHLLEKLGQGAMGVVFKARHRVLQNVVAVKVLPGERVKDPDAVARFHREGKAAARLNHPHIVRALDAREADGFHFLVMDFVEGVDLARIISGAGRLSVASACELVRQAALGLQHAFENKLVHRDVKPSNLMLANDGKVKVLDLGLARLTTSPEDDLTGSGQTMGTLDYMAPEQAENARAVDIRADIYSLGCTLYHFLAGQPPFAGPEFPNVYTKIYAHGNTPPPPITNFRSDVPPELVAGLKRMLAKKPADRFATPGEVAAALLPFSEGADLTALLALNSGEADARSPQNRASTKPQHRNDTVKVGGRNRLSRFAAAAALFLVLGSAIAGGLVWLFTHNRGGQTTAGAGLAAATSEKEPEQDGGRNSAPDTGKPQATDTTKPSSTAPAVPVADKDLAQAGYGILKQYCYRCHGIDFKVPGLNILDRGILTASRGKDKMSYVVPGSPDKSFIWERVGVTGEMPPKKPRPTETEKQTLKRWIEAGVPFPGRQRRRFSSDKDALTAIRDHLHSADKDDRKYLRYFTLTHLYNNHQHVTADELRLYRAALAKLVNSLSWKLDPVVPKAIDKEETVFVVDLRTLGWDKPGLWKEVLKLYPYGLSHDAPADVLRDLSQEVSDLSGNSLPYLRADWFIANASRPPLYHTLLQLPEHARLLEQQLKVDVQKDFRDNQLARAGFLASGVSKQNRLVDRHPAAYGAYWKSYDFKSNEGAGNLLDFPLGPLFPEHPFERQAFEHAGGEIIFNLPNGLQGYLLVNDKDKRIDAGPIEIVRDSQETQGTPVIVPGLSCMACHKHGMIRFEDRLRKGSTVADDALTKLQKLTRTKDEMNALLDKDEHRFLRALEDVAGPFLRAGEDEKKDIREFAEPVGAIARLYIKDVGLEEAAFELGLDDPKKLKERIEGNRNLQKLGLAPLLEPGGVIKRDVWSSQEFTSSPFQKAASELGLGSPRVF